MQYRLINWYQTTFYLKNSLEIFIFSLYKSIFVQMVQGNKTLWRPIKYDGHNYVTSTIKNSVPTKKYISYDNQKYSNLHDVEWYLGLIQRIETKNKLPCSTEVKWINIRCCYGFSKRSFWRFSRNLRLIIGPSIDTWKILLVSSINSACVNWIDKSWCVACSKSLNSANFHSIFYMIEVCN